MSTETKNFGLSKDDEEDFYSIDRVNANADKVDTVLGNVAIFEKAAGTATEILLSGVTNNDGNSKTFVVSYNNNAATTKINGKPLYKQGTEESPKLVAGQAVSIWYNATNNCFYIKEGGNSSTVNGHTVNADVPKDAKFTDTIYEHPEKHPASMITGLPTKLPADGGNADTVGNVGKAGFVRNYQGVQAGTNVLTWATTIGDHEVATGRIFNAHGVPTEFGFVDGDCDIWATVTSLSPANEADGYRQLEIRDVRSNSKFYNYQMGGTWQGWTATNATTLGGKTDDKFVQYVGDAAYIKKQVGIEGGQLGFQRASNSSFTTDPYIDTIGERFRFVCCDAAGTKVTDIPLGEQKGAQNYMAIFTAGTSDVTTGVTNLGKNILYIKYKA